ncbi:MAG: N-acetylmuramoyl-L-alanine amidase [Proteobacteria bacterium]|nr:N-acetylmuramoyl-L-alanine amidase [Pseudomonadota bacterium]MBU2260880.1 N-acetylmuramoyl-L-alanine amidase [Pseudomonadota bacterium]
MKGSRLKFIFFLPALLLYCLLPMTGAAAQPKMHVVLIDPAHGGEDKGVVSDKLREKDLTLKIALLIRKEAQKAGNLQVQLTRDSDRGATLAERTAAVARFKPDCLVSLHVNAGFGKKAAGYEVYFPGFRQTVAGGGDSAAILKDMAKNKHLNDSVSLAQQIQAGLDKVFPRKGRGLRDAPSPLLDGLNVPGLVVELGFATNPEERKKLVEEETQLAVAQALVRGLQAYFQKGP